MTCFETSPCWRNLSLKTILASVAMNVAFAASPTAPWQSPPGWTKTRGGEGGRVIKVTTLAASGAGSLAEALEANGPRTIVFEVGGIIDLANHSLKLSESQVTVAGETAPSPGITLIRGGLGITASDVILRHIRIRVGEAGHAKHSGWEVDGASTNAAHDVIVEHCSFSWATDENLSASGPRFNGKTPEEWRAHTSHRITFYQCIVGEGLNNSTHGKTGLHSMGSLIHDNTSDIAIIGNLYTSNGGRNPLFKGGARGVVVNNLIFNTGAGVTYGLVPQEWAGHEWVRGQITIVGNVIRRGPSSPAAPAPFRAGSPFAAPECDAYLKDNLCLDLDGRPMATQLAVYARPGLERPGEFRLMDHPLDWPEGLEAKAARDTAEWVLANVGARPWDRDAVDQRLVEGARTGRGKIIDSEAEVGGYESLTKGPKSE